MSVDPGCDASHKIVEAPDAEHENDELPLRELICRIWRIAYPALGQGLVQASLGIVPLFFLGRIRNTEQLAAFGLVNSVIYICGYSFINGTLNGICTFSAQDWGAGLYHNIGLTLQRAVIITFLLLVPMVSLWSNLSRILVSMGQPPEVVRHIWPFLMIRFPGIFLEVFNGSIQRTLSSIGNTRISFVVSFTQTILNAGLTALLVPRLELRGAALACSVSDLCALLTISVLASRDSDFRRCWDGLSWKAFHGWLPYLAVCIPAFVLHATEYWSWTLQDVLSGLISTEALATNAIAPPLVLTQYCIGGTLGMASSVVVGNLLGESRPGQARRAAWLCVRLVLPCLLPTSICVYVFRRWIAYSFTDDKVVGDTVADLLLITQVFALFDGHQAVLTGVVGGTGKQAAAAQIITICYWLIGLPAGVVLAFGFFGLRPLGIFGLWYGMVVAVALHALSFGVFVWRFDWDQIASDVQQRQLEDKTREVSARTYEGYELTTRDEAKDDSMNLGISGLDGV